MVDFIVISSLRIGSNLISLRIPGASMLVLNSTKDVQELLVKRSAIYSDRCVTSL